MEKKIFIVHGIPGLWKTTFACFLRRAICSADDYFTHGDKYLWSADKLGLAHDWCKRKCRRFMKIGIDRVIVCNTNTTEKEMKPYIELAKEFGYGFFDYC